MQFDLRAHTITHTHTRTQPNDGIVSFSQLSSKSVSFDLNLYADKTT